MDRQSIYGTPGRARELVEQVQEFYLTCYSGKEPDAEVLLLTVGALGERVVLMLYAVSPDTICICVEGDADLVGAGEIIYASVEQCAFRVRHFHPTEPHLARRVVGFGPNMETA
jgi:hypothetical protein